MTDLCQWWVPNPAGHRQMLTSVGFTLERESGVYAIPFGPAHPSRGRGPCTTTRKLLHQALAETTACSTMRRWCGPSWDEAPTQGSADPGDLQRAAARSSAAAIRSL